MDTVATTSPLVMPNLARRSETYTNPKTARNLDNDFFISLTKEINEGLRTPHVSRKEVLQAIASGKIRPDVVEDLEDALFGVIMEEAIQEPNESMDDVMEFLRQR